LKFWKPNSLLLSTQTIEFGVNSDGGSRIFLNDNRLFNFWKWNGVDSFYVLDSYTTGGTAEDLRGLWVRLVKDKKYR